MAITIYERVKLRQCRVVGVSLNSVKMAARITIEHPFNDDLVDVEGTLGSWARQEMGLEVDFRQQQASLPLAYEGDPPSSVERTATGATLRWEKETSEEG